MPEVIKALCRQIISEADAIVQYTDDISAVDGLESDSANEFRAIRFDELSHIQTLVVALTKELIVTEDAGGEDD